MGKISPTAGLYNYVTDSPPPDTSGYVLSNKATLIDGDKTTGCGSWNGWNVVYESYGLDLGSVQKVGSFKLYDIFGSGTVDSAQVIILYGSDNNNWTQLEVLDWTTNIQRTGGSPGIWTITLNTPTAARYWRIYIGGVFSVNATSVEFSELEAYTPTTTSGSGIITSDALINVPEIRTINSNAYILPHSAANPYYFEVDQRTVQRFMQECREPKLKHDCDHVLSSGRYTLNSCPRCLGNGYYYDIQFNEVGLVEQITDENKLAQELEKITLTLIGDNVFHDQYGTLLRSAYSTAPTRELQETELKSSIINAVLHLKQLQELEISDGSPFSARELINRIEKIEIFGYLANPTSVGYAVYVVTLSGAEAVLQGTIIL